MEGTLATRPGHRAGRSAGKRGHVVAGIDRAPSEPTSASGGPLFTFVDLFAGIGGIRLGLERARGRCVYSVENDRYARLTYERNFGSVEHDDARTIKPADIPAYDVLAAGFPCQPFSIAGVSKKNSLGRPHGFDDAVSGNLFFSIRDLVRDTRPPVVFLENVKNLLTHDHRNTFYRIRLRSPAR